MVDSFRLRLDFGIHATQDVQSMSVDKHIEFIIPYTENNTFAAVLRYTIEKERLGGHLLELLEAQNDGRRDELYLLLYSKKCATLIQPYWNRIKQQDAKSNIARLKLQLSVGDEVIKCQKLVHEFISEYRLNNNSKKSTTITDGKLARNRNRKRDDRSNSDNILCIDMKLIVKKICISYKPKPEKISIMLCEEHWKYCNKLLSCNVLCHAPRRLLTSNNRAKHMTEQRHKKLLKSFLINDFIKNKQLLAIAFLIPSVLILRGIDTIDGIQISVDKPSMCQSRVINLLRPAVLRQYFGLDLDIPTNRDDLVWRSSYGSGSGTTSVGINPRHWTTREMTYPMKIIAKYVYQYLKRQFANDNAIDILQFNHITILYYYQKKIHIDKRRLHEIMLGYHTDNLYNHSGNFIQSSNSQVENTFT